MAVEVIEASKQFGEFRALDKVSVSAPDGGLTALLGPSGSGKSTLLRIIAGLERPDEGAVVVDGVEMTKAPVRRRGIGFVFQHYAPFKHMTVAENVAFGLRVRKKPKQEIRERVAELISLVRLDGLGERYPSQLSGGQVQRMALARALAPKPRLLLLDEPFGALDVQVRRQLREWLRALHDQIQVTTVFVTHDQEEAMDLAGEIVLMREGKVEQCGTPRELYEQPASAFVMSFVGPVNRIGDALLRPHDIQLLGETYGHLGRPYRPLGDDRDGRPDGGPGRNSRLGGGPYGGDGEAMVRRVVRLGFEVRVELTLQDGSEVWAQTTREAADELEIEEGQILAVRVPAPKVFS